MSDKLWPDAYMPTEDHRQAIAEKDKTIATQKQEIERLTADHTTACNMLSYTDTDRDRLIAEVERLNRFVRDQGTTCYPCDKCGHARTRRECLHCEIERLTAVLDKYRAAAKPTLAKIERDHREFGWAKQHDLLHNAVAFDKATLGQGQDGTPA